MTRADVREAMGAAGAELARREHDVESRRRALRGGARGGGGRRRGRRCRAARGERGRGGRRDLGGHGRGEGDRPPPRRGRAWVERSARIPAWAWLAAIVVGSAVVPRRSSAAGSSRRSSWSTRSSGPRSRAASPTPASRSCATSPIPGYSVVYPLLISPVYALFESLPDAYAGVKALNAVVMSLAAVPAYFLARRVVARRARAARGAPRGRAPVARLHGHGHDRERLLPALPRRRARARARPRAADCRAESSLLLALARRSRSRRASRRSRSLPAVLLAPLLLAVFERRGVARDDLAVPLAVRRSSRARASLRSPCSSSPGARRRSCSAPTRRSASASYDVGEVAAVPLVARRRALALRPRDPARRDDRPRRPRSLARRAAPGVPRGDGRADGLPRPGRRRRSRPEFSDRIEERNLFYVAPLFCIALLAWVERGAPRPRVLAPVAAVVSALLVVAIPFDRFLTTSAITDTLMLLPLWSLQDRIGTSWITLAALVLAAGARRARSSSCRAATRSRSRCSCSASGSSRSGRSGGGRTASSASRAARSSRESARPTATGSIARCRATARGRVPLDGAHRPAHGEPERVLQPRRRARLLRHRSDARAACRRRACGSIRRPGASRSRTAAPVRDRYLLADSSFEPDGSRARAGQGLGGDALARERRRSCPPSGSTASTRTTRGPGRRSRTCGAGAVRGGSPSSLSSDPSLFLEPQTVVARSNGAVVGRVRLPAGGASRAERPGRARRRDERLPRRLHRHADRGSGRGHRRREPGSARARRPLQPLRLQAADREDRLRRVARCRHPLLGIGNYIQGSLGGLVEAAAGEHEIVAFAPTSLRGPERIRARARGDRRRAAARGRSRSRTRLRTAWSRAGASRRGAAARPLRRRSTSRTGCTRRSSAGVRATTIHDLVPLHHPEWTTPRTRSMHGAQVPRTPPRPATSSSSTRRTRAVT